MTFLGFLGFCVVVIGILAIIITIAFKNQDINKVAIEKLHTEIKDVCTKNGIQNADLLVSPKYDVLVFDDKVQKLAYFRNTSRKEVLIKKGQSNITEYLKTVSLTPKIIDYKNITAAEIIIDDNTITKTSRGSQIGGALIGGAIAGGLGALIGGLSGSTKSEKKIKKIKLKIYLNSSSESTLVVEYLENQFGVNADSELAEIALKSIEKVYDILKVILATKKEEKQDQLINSVSSNSLSDQLKKLSNLYKDGSLTKDEYDRAKQKILN